MRYPDAVKIADLQGQPVVDAEGTELGNLNELVVDVRSGRIAYVVVASGGFLGIGDRLYAIPWRSVHVDDERRLVLDRPGLDESTGFDRENWPETDDPRWFQ